MMLARWASAVLTLMLRRLATSLLLLPSARSWRISRSRGVRREREDLAESEGSVVTAASETRVEKKGFVLAKGLDGVEEDAVGFVLEDIAAGARFDDLLDQFVGLVHGENENFGGGRGFANLASGFDAVEERHADVQDGNLGFVLGGLFDGVAAVGGFGADLPAGVRLEKSAEAGADNGVIIRDQDGELRHRWSP